MALNYTANTDFNSDGEFSECELDVSWATLQVKKLLELSGGSSIAIGTDNFNVIDDDSFKSAVKAMVAINVSASIASDGCASASSLPISVSLPPEELAKLPYFESPTIAIMGTTNESLIQYDYSGNNRHLDFNSGDFANYFKMIKSLKQCFSVNRTGGETGLELGNSSELLGSGSFTVKFDSYGINQAWTSKYITNLDSSDSHGFELVYDGTKFLLNIKHSTENSEWKPLGELPGAINVSEWMTTTLVYDNSTKTFTLYVYQGDTNHTLGSFTLNSDQDEIGNSDKLKLFGANASWNPLRNILVYKKSISDSKIKSMNDNGDKLNPLYFFACDDTHESYNNSAVGANNEHKLTSHKSLNNNIEATFSGWGDNDWANGFHAVEQSGEQSIKLSSSGSDHSMTVADGGIDWGSNFLFSMRFFATEGQGIIFEKADGTTSGFTCNYFGDTMYFTYHGARGFSTPCPLNQWHSVVFQKNEKYFGLYVDGKLVQQMDKWHVTSGDFGGYDADSIQTSWKTKNLKIGGSNNFFVKEIALLNVPYGHYPIAAWDAATYGLSSSDYVGKPDIPQITALANGNYWS